MADDGNDVARPADARLLQINRQATAVRLVAGLAHELNNALQVVSGSVELLADRTDIPADALARIHKIGGQVDKASAAIRHVTTYTRDRAGQGGRADLCAVVEQALALRAYPIGRAGITATVDRPPVPLEVAADGRHVLQVVLNLVVNAEEALAHQPRRTLAIAVHQDNGVARLTVTDSGHGVPEDLRSRIFEPFFTTRTDERTMGLGLPVALALAQQAGGCLTLEDSGTGTTTFVVAWPAWTA